jgi:hypothetical protein
MFTTPEDWTLVAREMFATVPDARTQFADIDRLVAQELVDWHPGETWNASIRKQQSEC